MTPEPKERCTCHYKCSRLHAGFDFVSPRNRRRHAEFDRIGRIIPLKYVVNRHRDPHEHRLGGHAQGGESSQQHGRDSTTPVPLYRALAGNCEQGAVIDSHIEEYCHRGPTQYGIHILPRRILGVDEAIHRQTWKLQSILDGAKVPEAIQDRILKMMFGKIQLPATYETASGQLALDTSNLELGPLLRLAGVEWDGGRHGIEALSSFKGLCGTFKDYGMPQTQRWRMCIGEDENWHSPVLLPPSHQDDYNIRTGLKCNCTIGTKELARNCSTCSEHCTSDGCGIARKDMLRFEYFPIGPILRKLCSSRSVCHELQAMWRDKDRWFLRDSMPRPVYKEWWDGYRASELSYFWNSSQEFEVPVVCRQCYACYATTPNKCSELSDPANWDTTVGEYNFQCSDCGSGVSSPRRYAKGDPRNIALMAHWDGFQSAKTAHRSTWTVEVQILNTGSRTKLPPIPVLFIPPCDDKNVGQHKLKCLDAFLEPFIRELEELYVEGIPLVYNYPTELLDVTVDSMNDTQCVLRAILAVFTGDHPAQCKFGGWNLTGYAACRNCIMSTRWMKKKSRVGTGELQEGGISGRAVYDDNRRQMRFPPPVRHIADVRQAAINMRIAGTTAERLKISRECGISGMTRAWRLHELNGFCLSKDLVYDTMHILALCLFKKYCENLIDSIPRQDRKRFEEALDEVTARKPKGLDGRWPNAPFDRLGYFKAEEYTRFILYCLPHILREVNISVHSEIGTLGILLVEIARLFYIRSRDEGWTTDTLAKARSLLASWRVRSEEAWGPNGAILEHVAGSGEILDGVERHGPHYVYWCYRFERMVSDYGRTRTNQKDQEVTYSTHFARRFFTNISQQIWEDDDGLFPHQRALSKLHASLRAPTDYRRQHKSRFVSSFECPEWHGNSVVIVSNQTVAIELWNAMMSCVESYGCKHMLLGRGVGIGSNRRLSARLSPSARISLKQNWMEAVALDGNSLLDEISDTCTPLRSAVWRGEVYRPGDHIVVLQDGSSDGTHPLNWKALVRRIFVHEFNNHMDIFFEADWYKQQFNQDSRRNIIGWKRDEYSQFTLLELKLTPAHGNNCRPISRILHKFFPIRRGSVVNGRGMEICALEIGDTLWREIPATIGNCPPFPVIGDVMTAIEESTAPEESRLCVVREVIRPLHGAGMEVQAEDVGEDGDSDGEEEDDAQELQNLCQNDIGTVGVSWITVTGVRSDCPIYRASTKIDAKIHFQSLLELKANFEPVRFQGDLPIRWNIL